MGAIFWLSGRESITVSEQGLVNFFFFKTLHVIEYGILFVTTLRAVQNTFRMGRIASFYAAFMITVLYAVSDELHQVFVPTREGKLRDVIIDAIGASLSWYMTATVLPRAPARLRKLAKRWQLL
jgi:VanZ family protein